MLIKREVFPRKLDAVTSKLILSIPEGMGNPIPLWKLAGMMDMTEDATEDLIKEITIEYFVPIYYTANKELYIATTLNEQKAGNKVFKEKVDIDRKRYSAVMTSSLDNWKSNKEFTI